MSYQYLDVGIILIFTCGNKDFYGTKKNKAYGQCINYFLWQANFLNNKRLIKIILGIQSERGMKIYINI